VIIDDDESVRTALQSLFRSLGFQVEVSASAEDFWHSAQVHDPACLILDVRMPGMDGLELQRRLAAAARRVPIIFITAHLDDHTRAQALRAGAVDFLPKPFSEKALLDAVHSALENAGQRA
jgi:FixJ family two-component response regulator